MQGAGFEPAQALSHGVLSAAHLVAPFSGPVLGRLLLKGALTGHSEKADRTRVPVRTGSRYQKDDR